MGENRHRHYWMAALTLIAMGALALWLATPAAPTQEAAEIQAPATPGARLESQAGLSHLLRAETEQKTERQKTFANKMSFTAGGA